MRPARTAATRKRQRRSAAVPLAEERGEQRILRAARRLFVRAGGAGFSARGVAKEAGVSLGAVQHFFPSKDALLAATLEHVLAEFRRAYERLQEELPFNAEARLLGVIDLLVADVWRQDSRKFFLGLHALSCHNRFAERLLGAMCEHHQRRLAGFIGAARPHLTEQQCLDLALQLCAMIDGLMIYTGPRSHTIKPRPRLAAVMKHSALRLLSPAP
jgi:AcrR family transcriptional regulator